MKTKADLLTEKITILLSESAEPSKGYRLQEGDLKKLKGVYPLFKAYREALGDRCCYPVLRGNLLEIEVLPATANSPYPLVSFLADLVATSVELQRNASLTTPLAHGVAVRRPHLVGVLKATTAADANHHLKATLHTAEGPREVPVLTSADFTEPDAEGDLSMTSTWIVVGTRRDDARGHRLLVTDNDLFVLLPRNDPRWSWTAIHHRADNTTYLEGTLMRKSKSDPWTVASGARFVTEAELEGVEA
jgi:hypothetical protein